MEVIASPRDRILTLVFTILTYGLIILFLILFLIKTPIPPYPPEIKPEIEIDFQGGGGLDGVEGMGNPVQKSTELTKNNTTGSEEDVFASKVEDPVLTVNEHKKKIKKKEKEAEQKTAVQQDPQPSPELTNLIDKFKKDIRQSGSNSNMEGTGKASSGEGSGKGDKEGTGSGNNPGPGKGNGFSLRGRRLLQRPQLLDNSQEEGRVVVEIIVDENGNVIEANPGQRGSTTTSAYLYSLARQAAKTAKFNASPEGIHEQRGTYTFVFSLN